MWFHRGKVFCPMAMKLRALDEGPDILLDSRGVLVGRHPACNVRLDSLRVSRHHCFLIHENGEVTVRDLGSTNGIRINGQRVETGQLKLGDELSIAHLRYRLLDDHGAEEGASPRSPVNDLLSPTSRIGFTNRN
jgi:hypothetical protein